jgi:integral membrane protein
MKLFRVVSLSEGVSWLLLLLVAMPLKYVWGWPQGVQVLGRIHGGLFVAFGVTLAIAATEAGWNARQVVRAILASFVPGGAFWLERELRRESDAAEGRAPL